MFSRTSRQIKTTKNYLGTVISVVHDHTLDLTKRSALFSRGLSILTDLGLVRLVYLSTLVVFILCRFCLFVFSVLFFTI